MEKVARIRDSRGAYRGLIRKQTTRRRWGDIIKVDFKGIDWRV